MNTDKTLLQSIEELASQIRHLRDQSFQQYSALVEQVLREQITDTQSIEKIMDGLLDFCDERRFTDIYQQLCRYVYYKHPMLVGEHISLFRAQFETNEDNTHEQQGG